MLFKKSLRIERHTQKYGAKWTKNEAQNGTKIINFVKIVLDLEKLKNEQIFKNFRKICKKRLFQ